MKKVTSTEYVAFIEQHLGHISITGVLGAIHWVNAYTGHVLASKHTTQGNIIYKILAE